jgi:hypothetical protein
LIEDAAGDIKPILANLHDRQVTSRYKTQLNLALKGLHDLRSELRIPEGLD